MATFPHHFKSCYSSHFIMFSSLELAQKAVNDSAQRAFVESLRNSAPRPSDVVNDLRFSQWSTASELLYTAARFLQDVNPQLAKQVMLLAIKECNGLQKHGRLPKRLHSQMRALAQKMAKVVGALPCIDHCCQAPCPPPWCPDGSCDVHVEVRHPHGQDQVALTSGEAKNPGPPKSANKKVGKKMKKAVKAMVGSGAYKKKKPAKSGLVAQALRPKQAGFKGKGDYGEDLGSSLGGWLGKKASGLFKSIFGLGDYSHNEAPEKNSLVAGTSPPAVMNKGQAFIFRHREYITDIQSSVNFTNVTYPLNPGQFKLFPWLAPLASAFEEWKPLGMLVEYKSLTSPLAPNSSGSVTISTEYNPTKPPFTSKIQAENAEYATSCRPCDSMLHAIECEPKECPVNVLQVRIGGVPAGQDVRFYDLANIQIMTQGQASSTVIGELWATYEFAFYKPLFNTGLGLNILTDKYHLGACQTSAPLGTFFQSVPGSLIGSAITGTTVTLPSSISTGEYLVSLQWFAAGNTLTAGSWTLTPSNATVLNMFSSSTGPDQLPYSSVLTNVGGVGMAQNFLNFVLSVNAPGASQASVLIACNTSGLTSCAGDLIITQINGSVVS